MENDEFCWQERSTNEVFDSGQSLFDMFNILDGPPDKRRETNGSSAARMKPISILPQPFVVRTQ